MDLLLLSLLGALGTAALYDHLTDDDTDAEDARTEPPAPQTPSIPPPAASQPEPAPPGSGTNTPLPSENALRVNGTADSDFMIFGAPEGRPALDGIIVNGLGGDDVISISAQLAQINGGDGHDLILGQLNNSQVNGGSGDDTIMLLGDGNTVYGGQGHDLLTLQGESYIAHGGAGDDSLRGYGLADGALYGGQGNDHLELWAETLNSDTQAALYGGLGHDMLLLDTSGSITGPAPLLHGGAGGDLFVIQLTPTPTAPLGADGAVQTTTTIAEIADFNPSQDAIQLTLSPLADGSLPSVEITSVAADPSGQAMGSYITLRYTSTLVTPGGPSQSVSMASQIWLPGVSDLNSAQISVSARAA